MAVANGTLPRFRSGQTLDTISAAQLNTLVDAVDVVRRSHGGGGVNGYWGARHVFSSRGQRSNPTPTPIEEAVIDAFTSGLSGDAGAAMTCRRLDAAGLPTGTAFTVYAISYDPSGAAGLIGRVNLATAFPRLRVGDVIQFATMTYRGQSRPVCITTFSRPCNV